MIVERADLLAARSQEEEAAGVGPEPAPSLPDREPDHANRGHQQQDGEPHQRARYQPGDRDDKQHPKSVNGDPHQQLIGGELIRVGPEKADDAAGCLERDPEQQVAGDGDERRRDGE